MAVTWVDLLGWVLLLVSFPSMTSKEGVCCSYGEGRHFRELEPLHMSVCELPAWPQCIP